MIINFVGDICLQDIDLSNYSLDNSIIDLFKKSDLNVCNLESAITNADIKVWNQPIYKKIIPKNNFIFEYFNIFSLANNHIMDYKADGLKDTVNFLKQHDKKFFGAGFDLNSALRPLLITNDNVNVAFVGFTRWQNATDSTPGTAPDRINTLIKIVKSLKEKEIFVILYAHWNYINSYYPGPDSRKIAKKLIDAGADLIIGTHPHVIQGIECYKDKYICYSLGNFIFDYDFSRLSNNLDILKVNYNYILSVNIEKNFNYSINIVPCEYYSSATSMLRGQEKNKFLQALDFISKKIISNDYPKVFYRESHHILKFTNNVFRMAETNYFLTILSRLHKGRLEDLKVFLYYNFTRLFSKISLNYHKNVMKLK